MGWLIDTNLWIAVERGALAAADTHALLTSNAKGFADIPGLKMVVL